MKNMFWLSILVISSTSMLSMQNKNNFDPSLSAETATNYSNNVKIEMPSNIELDSTGSNKRHAKRKQIACVAFLDAQFWGLWV